MSPSCIFWIFCSLGLLLDPPKAFLAQGTDFNDEFSDELLILSKVSENLTVDQVAIRNFHCQEKIVVAQSSPKGGVSSSREVLNTYSVRLKRDQTLPTQMNFIETRTLSDSKTDTDPPLDFPVIDKPFTGAISRMFDLENRFSNDFHRDREEKLEGQPCLVVRFETVPELTSRQLTILGKAVFLRQRGFLWISLDDNRILRISARQTKLPKGCRRYEYQIDYAPQNLFGRQLYLPAHVSLQVETKDTNYSIGQTYSQFEACP